MDNLNTYVISSLYETFPPEEAFRLSKCPGIHYTPKHGLHAGKVSKRPNLSENPAKTGKLALVKCFFH
jgi:hypothetical protein